MIRPSSKPGHTAFALAVWLCLATVAPAAAQEPLPASLESFRSETVSIGADRFHYVRGGRGTPVILIHGFPQTWREWSAVMPILAAAGYDVIAIDLPGIAGSTNADRDFTKHALARDVAALGERLGIERAHIVGHDIGAMVAYAHAGLFPARTRSLTYFEAPLPGTPEYAASTKSPRAWHFAFHGHKDVPERLVAGREAYYYGQFIREKSANSGRPSEDEIAAYANAYADPGTMNAGFELYRALERDVEDNKPLIARKLTMPVLALTAEKSSPEPFDLPMLQPLATDVRGGVVPGTGHWIAEEKPEDLAARLIEHFQRADVKR